MRKKRNRDKVSFEVIPLIDVIMVLCLFFCIAAFLPQVQSTLDTKLPQSSGSDKAKEALVVSINQSGSLYIKNKPITRNELLSELKKNLNKDINTPILIAADKNLKYEKVVAVIDIIKKTGASQVGLATDE